MSHQTLLRPILFHPQTPLPLRQNHARSYSRPAVSMCRPSERPLLDVLVIGGGPAGLSVAVAAKHRGARRVLVVEEASELKEVVDIDLMPNAMRALNALSPAVGENFEQYVDDHPRNDAFSAVLTPSGDVIREVKYPAGSQKASMKWWQIQRSLIDSMPGTGFLLLKHKLVDLKHVNEYATAHFLVDDTVDNPSEIWPENKGNDSRAIEDLLLSPEDALQQYFDVIGEQDQKMVVRCRAKLVVAADGINSVVRALLYRDSGGGWEKFAKPVYSGYASLIVFGVPQISAEFSKEDLHELQTRYFKHAPLGAIACSKQSPVSVRLIIGRVGVGDGAPLYLNVTVATDESTIQTKSASELAQMGFDKALEMGVAPSLKRLFHAIATNKEGQISFKPFYLVPAAHTAACQPRYVSLETAGYPEGFYRPWYHRRVVLVGDAVHAGPNFQGQTTGLALEDALNLTMRLAAAEVWDGKCADVSEETLTEVFRQYRASRLERVSVHQESTLNLASEYDVERTGRLTQLFTTFDPTDIDGKQAVEE